MIEKVEFRNFKALRDVSLDLDRLTVLVGPNASGKTSILEGLLYLSELDGDTDPQEFFSGERSAKLLTSSDARGDMRLKGTSAEAVLGVAIGSDHCTLELGYPDDRGKGAKREIDGGVFGGTVSVVPVPKHTDFGPAVLLRLDVTSLVTASYSNEAVPRMAPDGEGLPSVLAHMLSTDEEGFRKLLDGVRSIIPSVLGMRFPRAKIIRTEPQIIKVDDKTITHRAEREYWGNSIEFDMAGTPGIPACMVSEGTLLVLGLLTAIMGVHRPRLALLDDLDRALHPKAQKDLVALLRRLLGQHPDLQIVATSHSPYLLDTLQPEEVRLTTLLDDGSVAIGRLDQHPKFEKWKDEMSPGEFWSLVGEKWVAEAEAGGKG